jgi:hypothetical protein
MTGEDRPAEGDEGYYERPADVPNEKWPIDWHTDDGNCSFKAGEIKVGKFFKDLPDATGRLSVSVGRDDVAISAGLNNFADQPSLAGGTLVNLSPAQAREIAATLEHAAAVVEANQPADDDHRGKSRTERIKKMLGLEGSA